MDDARAIGAEDGGSSSCVRRRVLTEVEPASRDYCLIVTDTFNYPVIACPVQALT